MDVRKTILDELQHISPAVANLPQGNTFSVPEGYFETLPAVILARVRLERLKASDGNNPFSIPQGYFDALPGRILDRIKEHETQDSISAREEIRHISPVLDSISRAPVYSVPEGYFESLELTVPLKLDKPSARVFQFGKAKRIIQYAVAACTAGVLMVGAFLFTSRNSGDDAMPISYDSAVKMNVTEEISDLNPEEINTYLEQTPEVGYAVHVGTEDLNIEEVLDAASDEEIKEYLNETAEPGEKIKGS